MSVRPLLLAAVAAVVPSFASNLFATVAETDAAKPASPFVAVLMSNFDAWDADRDGTLEKPEIEKLASDPTITGDAAAAAGALKQLTRGRNALPPLTKAYFDEYAKQLAAVGGEKESAKEAENATVDPGTSTASVAAENKGPKTNWDRYFLAGKSRIASGGAGPIWNHAFDAATLKQGPLGDCFFVAVTGSLALRDPARLNTLVQPIDAEGKTFRATFPNSEPFTFAAPTPALLAISGTTAGNGAWIAVMEQAFGKQKSRLAGGSLDVDGTDVLRSGGDSMPTIHAITGHKARRISFARTLEGRAAEKDAKLAELRSAIQEAIANKRVAVCGILPPAPRPGEIVNGVVTPAPARASATTKPAEDDVADGDGAAATRPDEKAGGTLPSFPKGIVKKHVYAIVSYDAATDVIELWNPHSNSFTPNGPAGLVNGYKTEKGRFKLPLSEAYQFYTSFTFESDQPAPPPTTRRAR